MKKINNILGWYGVLAILLAYVLVSFKVVSSQGTIYQLLNLTGALGIVVEALGKRDIQPAILNIIWALVAFATLIRLAVS